MSNLLHGVKMSCQNNESGPLSWLKRTLLDEGPGWLMGAQTGPSVLSRTVFWLVSPTFDLVGRALAGSHSDRPTANCVNAESAFLLEFSCSFLPSAFKSNHFWRLFYLFAQENYFLFNKIYKNLPLRNMLRFLQFLQSLLSSLAYFSLQLLPCNFSF